MDSRDFSSSLLRWFDKHGRKDLPWQVDISPYRVWISEIMLQQTQVKTVIPYFQRFMQRFPSVGKLAEASEDEVLHHWTGLGYYARARNLHKTARIVAGKYKSTFPPNLTALQELPGIGRSTAGAIASISMNERAAILDGNVKRVLSRCFAVHGYPGESKVSKELWELATRLTPVKRVADYTQAIMDLGATVCTRTKPACDICPMSRKCIACKEGTIDQHPGRKASRPLPTKSVSMLMIANQQGEVLLEKRPNQGIWGGLWSFPECELDDVNNQLPRFGLAPEMLETEQPLPVFRHTFSHFHLDITPVHMKLNCHADIISDSQKSMWFHPHKKTEVGLSAPVSRLLENIKIDSQTEAKQPETRA